ncbi:PREDICTED: C-C motif chemokine 3-like 1 [Miniopterus natalensis]|uniref:C-C motif chemokine 3-like 1 n=1 Tax=Miniopterus natalensis TaxID=291302 RepID=UPI0007A70303|nr:PREDICTED: C-C motif chemokine 3-like 1 [Miniopterus natalensis]
MKFLGTMVLVFLCTRVLYAYEEERTDIAPTCCMSYTSRQIPRRFVAAYFKTSGQCSKSGIVFLTKKGRHICANPSNAWVQEYINNMEEAPEAA